MIIASRTETTLRESMCITSAYNFRRAVESAGRISGGLLPARRKSRVLHDDASSAHLSTPCPETTPSKSRPGKRVVRWPFAQSRRRPLVRSVSTSLPSFSCPRRAHEEGRTTSRTTALRQINGRIPHKLRTISCERVLVQIDVTWRDAKEIYLPKYSELALSPVSLIRLLLSFRKVVLLFFIWTDLSNRGKMLARADRC